MPTSRQANCAGCSTTYLVPAARAERGELAFGTIDSWLAWKLTGGRVHVTDVANASRTMLFDIHRLCWDDELLALLDIPAALLPQIVDSSSRIALLDETLLGAPIPLTGIAGDQQAATFGQACLRQGMAKNTYGNRLLPDDEHWRAADGLKPAHAHHRRLAAQRRNHLPARRQRVHGRGHRAMAARRTENDHPLRRDRSPRRLRAGQRWRLSGAGAHTGLGAPYWDPYARGALLGMTRGTKCAHIARAALEAIAFQSAEVLGAMERDSARPLSEPARRWGGVPHATTCYCSFQADLLGVAVVRPQVTETTALGAAFLAGLAVGFWQDEGELATLWQAERRFEPSMPPARRDSLMAGWRRAVDRARQLGGAPMNPDCPSACAGFVGRAEGRPTP